jgi:hypothetical protein
MPVYPNVTSPYPQYWTIFGHSYYNASLGTVTGQGRIDGYLRRMMNITQGVNWQNHATVGARVTQGWNAASFATDSGWGRIMQLTTGNPTPLQLAATAPYLTRGVNNAGGAYLLGYGANDLGYNGNTPLWNTIYENTLVACISRFRMSALGGTVYDNYPGGIGAGYTANGTGISTFGGGAGASIIATPSSACTGSALVSLNGTNSAWTITLPSDYDGEVVSLLFVLPPGGVSSTVTFSGTAGVTGTINPASQSAPQPASGGASSCYVPLCYRVKTLTASNAGQTIIATLTTADSGGTKLYCDSWWLEADNPPPVVVVNMMRCLTAALTYPPYTVVNGYNAWVGSFTAASLSGVALTSMPTTVTLASGNYLGGTAGGLGTLTPGGVAAAGTFTVPCTSGTATIAYTGITVGNSSTSTPGAFTGCSVVSGTGSFTSNTITTPGPVDSDVETFNTYTASAIAQFDSMVQLADIDSACGKIPQLYSYDGLHLNELGASKAATVIMNAIERMTPTSPFDAASDLNPPAQHLVPLSIPRIGANAMNVYAPGGGFAGVSATDATPAVFSLQSGQSIANGTKVMLSGGTIPTGFSSLLEYYVVSSSSNTFELALTAGGTGVASTSTGSGMTVSQTGQWYAPDTFGGLSSTTYTPVAGDQWALPFFISGGVVTLCAWGMQTVAAGTSVSVFAAIYDDHQYSGYPQFMVDQIVNYTGSALSLPATASTNFVSTPNSGSTGYFNWVMEPGLWWFVIQIVAVSSPPTFAMWTGPSHFVPQLGANGAAPASAAVAPCAWKRSAAVATNQMSGRFPQGAVPVGPAPLVSVKVQ